MCGQCQCAYAFPDSVTWPIQPGDLLEAWVAPAQGSLSEIDTSNDHFAAILDPLSVDPMPVTTTLAVMPNPFAGVTRIRFAVPARTRAVVTVLDVAGRRVRALGRGIALAAGPGELSWDGCDESGRRCPPGVYAVRVGMAGHTLLRHVVLIR